MKRAGILLIGTMGGLLLAAPAPASPQDRGATPAPSGLERAVPSEAARSEVAVPIRSADREAVAERWGIEIEGLRLAAAGFMLDFRYRVLDAAKAAPIFQRRLKPTLTDERTGAVMAVPVPPKTGALRSSNEPQAGRTYFMFFANPGRFIPRHSSVTITIGDFAVSGVAVR